MANELVINAPGILLTLQQVIDNWANHPRSVYPFILQVISSVVEHSHQNKDLVITAFQCGAMITTACSINPQMFTGAVEECNSYLENLKKLLEEELNA